MSARFIFFIWSNGRLFPTSLLRVHLSTLRGKTIHCQSKSSLLHLFYFFPKKAKLNDDGHQKHLAYLPSFFKKANQENQYSTMTVFNSTLAIRLAYPHRLSRSIISDPYREILKEILDIGHSTVTWTVNLLNETFIPHPIDRFRFDRLPLL